MHMTDCLLIGFNDEPFEQFEQRVRLMGTQSGGYRDLGLAFFQSEGRLYRAMDILNDVCERERASRTSPFSNKDLLWLVITYLGSCLARRGLSFDYINSFQDGREALRQKLQTGQVLTVAITTTHYVSHDPLIEVISFVRACNPRVQIIVGGPFIYNRWMASAETLLPQLKLLNADIYVISQEGERTLARAVEAVKLQRSLADIPNLVYRDGAAWVTTSIEPEANSLAENPVNYGLFPRSDLGRFVLLRTSKSCPFACAFCNFPQRAGKYQMVEVSQVEAELDALRDLGTVDTLTFIDDTFNVPITRFKDILRMMIRNRYGFRWNSYFRCAQAACQCIAQCVELTIGEMVLAAFDGDRVRVVLRPRRKSFGDAACLGPLQRRGIPVSRHPPYFGGIGHG
jgi:radical SAM PhpK family P-methyltransferase